VTLDGYKVRAELTCTTRAGFQRYTFPRSDEARVLFDLHSPTEYGKIVHDAKVEKVNDKEIAGYVEMRSVAYRTGYQHYVLHFVARTNKPFRSMGGWVNGEIQPQAAEIAGQGDLGVFLNFQTEEGEVVLVQTGISLVSIDQARLNLDVEMKPFGWDFDACHAAARRVWNELLSRIEVEGGRPVDNVKFYTNLYRSYCSRTIWSDVNGKYVDMNERVQQLADPETRHPRIQPRAGLRGHVALPDNARPEPSRRRPRGQPPSAALPEARLRSRGPGHGLQHAGVRL